MAERNITTDVLLLILFFTTSAISWCVENVLLKIMLAHAIPSTIQCYGETLRGAVTKVAMIAAAFTVSFMSPWIHWWAGVMSILALLILLRFIIRRTYFIKPQCINFY